MRIVKIVIADDHLMVAKLLKSLIETNPQFEVVKLAGNGEEVVSFFLNANADVLLLDINMPKMNGFEALKKLRSIKPELKILVVSAQSDTKTVQVALKNGAVGYISKNADSTEITKALTAVMSGEIYCSSSVFQQIMRSYDSDTHIYGGSSKLTKLTKREVQVLKLIAQEQTSTQIADKLNISPRTVETHRKNIMTKLSVKNTAGLIKFAVNNSLLSEYA